MLWLTVEGESDDDADPAADDDQQMPEPKLSERDEFDIMMGVSTWVQYRGIISLVSPLACTKSGPEPGCTGSGQKAEAEEDI